MRPTFDAALAVVRRDVQTFLTYRFRLVAQGLNVFFSLTLFYFISRLVRVESFASPDAYYAFAVIGLIILQVLNSTLAGPPMILRQELVAGTFERMVLSPFGPVGGLVATLLFPFIYALVLGAVMLAFAGIAFGLDVQWSTAALAVPLSVLGTLSFLPFGILLLAATVLAKQAAGGTTWIIAGISLVSGLYFPVTLLPDWVEWTSDVQPFSSTVDLLRHVLVGTPLPDALWLDLARMAGFAVVVLPPAAWLLGRALRHSRRTGTIVEY